MTNNEKIELIADILEEEPADITAETKLETFLNWDSVAILSVIAEVSEHTGKFLHASEIERLNTVKDIMNVLGD